MKIYKGYYQCLVATLCSGECTHSRTTFITTDGHELELTSKLIVPYNELIEVLVLGSEIVHFNVLVPALRGQRNKNIALMRVLHPSQSANDNFWKNITDLARQLEVEYKRVSKGIWDVKVTPYVIEGYQGHRNVIHANWQWLKARVDKEHNYWHGVGGIYPGICGHAYINSDIAWTFDGCGIGTVIHEQGHNFGLNHTGTPSGGEYGERTWMGSGQNRAGFHAPHYNRLQLIDSDSIYQLEANTSKTLYLIRPECDAQSRMPGMWKGVYLPKAWDSNYMVSLMGNTLRVHRSDTGTSFVKTTMLRELQEGQEYNNHVTGLPGFKFIEERNGVAKVEVRWHSTTPAPEDAPWPDEFKREPDQIPTKDDSGIYYNPANDGQGFDLWFRDNVEVGYWYTYKDSGEQQWFLLKDGSIFFPEGNEDLSEVGTYQWVKLGEGKLKFIFTLNKVRGVEDVELIARKEEGSILAGFEDMPLSGVSTTQIGDQTVCYVYTWKRRNVGMSIVRYQEWFLSVDGTLLSTEGGAFRSDVTYVLNEEGEIVLDEDSCRINNTVHSLVHLLN